MALHRSPPSDSIHILRVAGVAAAWAFALAIGTAALIGLLAAPEDGSVTRADGTKLTAAEVTMQRTAESGVQPSRPVLLASRNLPNDKRGY